MKSGLKRQGSLEEVGKTNKVCTSLKMADNHGQQNHS
jgi:hypothetical protein